MNIKKLMRVALAFMVTTSAHLSAAKGLVISIRGGYLRHLLRYTTTAETTSPSEFSPQARFAGRLLEA